MAKHSAEPWEAIFASIYSSDATDEEWDTKVRIAVCDMRRDMPRGYDMAEANQSRIVACVNALAGIENPAELRRLLLDNRHSIHEAVRCDNEDLADELWRFLSKLS